MAIATTPNSKIDPDLQYWICQRLGKPLEAEPAALRKALCDDIERNGFGANPEFAKATTAIHGRELSVDQRTEIFEPKLRSEVAAFFRTVLELEPKARKSQYLDLLKRSKEFPHLACRLNEIKPLLKADTKKLLSRVKDKSRALAETLLLMVVRPPHTRAEIQHKVMAAQDSEYKLWLKAANKVRSKCRPIAKTNRTFLTDLDCWKFRALEKFAFRVKQIFGFCVLALIAYVVIGIGYKRIAGRPQNVPASTRAMPTEVQQPVEKRTTMARSTSEIENAQELIEEPWKEVLKKKPQSFKVMLRKECFSLGDEDLSGCLKLYVSRCQERLPAIKRHKLSAKYQLHEIASVVHQTRKRISQGSPGYFFHEHEVSLLRMAKKLEKTLGIKGK